jgi:hypothetical protein
VRDGDLTRPSGGTPWRGSENKSPDVVVRARREIIACNNQATLNTLPRLSLIGSVVSVATFYAMAASSLVCAVTVSNCLRPCAVESSTTSEIDFTVISWVAKSNAAFVFSRAASMTFKP